MVCFVKIDAPKPIIDLRHNFLITERLAQAQRLFQMWPRRPMIFHLGIDTSEVAVESSSESAMNARVDELQRALVILDAFTPIAGILVVEIAIEVGVKIPHLSQQKRHPKP